VRRRRRGGTALEFALTFPAFLLLMTAIIEYGWLLFVRTNLVLSTHAGCRAGAVIPPPDPDSGSSDHDGEDVAEDAIEQLLGQLGISCVTDDGSCDIDASVSGSSPSELITCSTTLTYDSIVGLIPVPSELSTYSISRMEIQR